ncbi:cell division protein FtsA [Candidatus Microgenomates bacterium]|nr:cell division protein FtsA [Candidatus Microgenomates bacterium]
MSRGKIIASIDIGSSKIATIIAQPNPESGTLQIMGVASLPTPVDGVRKGQIVDIEKATASVVACVEKAERMAGFAIDNLFTVVNGGHIQGQNSHGVVAVSSPEGEISQEDVVRVIEAARAISLPAAREIIHVLPCQFMVDGEAEIKDPVGMNGVRLEVEAHIVTAASGAIKNLTKCVSEVGAHISGVVFSGLAAASAVLSDTERELGVVLIDIGGGTTSLAVFSGGSLVHSRVLPIGAKNITNDLAIGLRTSLEAAEKIKLALAGGKKSDKEDDEIDLNSLGASDGEKTASRKTLVEGIIKPRLNEIWTMIGLELKSSGFGGRTPAGVVLTGGGAQTVGAAESAKRILALPVRIGSPTGISGLVDDVSTPAYAATVGSLIWAAASIPESSGFGFKSPLGGIPVKGAVGKIVDLIKGLLP